MAVKKGDFVQVQYTGKLDNGTAFDTTSKKEAEKQGIYNPKAKYGPVIICIGENHIVEGLDNALEGKEVGQSYEVKISPEEGFGKKDAKLIQMIATNKFTKEGINPMPGLQVNIDGTMGIIKSVSGGRTLVDFNHPLSGQNVNYEIRIDNIITDDSEKVKALLELKLGINDLEVQIAQDNAVVRTEKTLGIPAEVVDILSQETSKLVPSVKKISFDIKKKQEAKTADKATGTLNKAE
ncbi:MAG: peptidylprolyl isomerase [Nanoarchaeota archaeon]|nr:peptidylprolyl isomerase [Nanoarchaeota archaeon]